MGVSCVSCTRDFILFKGGENMDERAKELRREYKRKWNRANKDKVKAAQERYWQRKADEARAKEEAELKAE